MLKEWMNCQKLGDTCTNCRTKGVIFPKATSSYKGTEARLNGFHWVCSTQASTQYSSSWMCFMSCLQYPAPALEISAALPQIRIGPYIFCLGTKTLANFNATLARISPDFQLNVFTSPRMGILRILCPECYLGQTFLPYRC